MTKKSKRRQPKISGTSRESTFSAMLPEIRECVLEDARVNNCFPSWVVASIVASYYRIKIQPSYFDNSNKSNKTQRRK